jgi:hypothetical protein
LHDDGGDLIRSLWYNYYSYYYKDPNQSYGPPAQNGSIGALQTQAGFTYNSRDIYSNDRVVNDWGYIGESFDQGSAGGPGINSGGDQNSGKPPFFRDITIYGMDQHKWAAYTLINPLIKSWDHDTYDYSQGNGTMTHTMTIKYESVKYYSGAVGGAQPSDPVTGFADPAHYDVNLSPIAVPGSNNTVMVQGSIKTSVQGDKQDLQALSTGQNTLQNVIGAVGQGLVPTASAFLGGALAGTGALTQGLLSNFAPALAGGTPEAARQAAGALGGIFFPTPPITPASPSGYQNEAQQEADGNGGGSTVEPEYNAYNDAEY